MGKELPSIFKNNSNKKIENNKKVFYSKYERVGNVVDKDENVNDNQSIDLDNATTYNEALNNLFKNNQFIFNVPVEIITKKETLNTKIVSKVDNRLLTVNGVVIQLEDILSIKIKEN